MPLLMRPVTLILASQSPRRRELLSLLSIPFRVIVSGAPEDEHLTAGPAAYALATARLKAEVAAQMAARQIESDERARPVLIAADTAVALDGQILGKPVSTDDAAHMLRLLRGRIHDVHTALCLIDLASGREASSVQTTRVAMRRYTDDEIAAYVATGDPMDKAGAYAIQHPTFRPVAGLEGCYPGVMGLSLCDLITRLDQLDVAAPAEASAIEAAHQGYHCPLFPAVRSLCRG